MYDIYVLSSDCCQSLYIDHFPHVTSDALLSFSSLALPFCATAPAKKSTDQPRLWARNRQSVKRQTEEGCCIFKQLSKWEESQWWNKGTHTKYYQFMIKRNSSNNVRTIIMSLQLLLLYYTCKKKYIVVPILYRVNTYMYDSYTQCL